MDSPSVSEVKNNIVELDSIKELLNHRGGIIFWNESHIDSPTLLFKARRKYTLINYDMHRVVAVFEFSRIIQVINELNRCQTKDDTAVVINRYAAMSPPLHDLLLKKERGFDKTSITPPQTKRVSYKEIKAEDLPWLYRNFHWLGGLTLGLFITPLSLFSIMGINFLYSPPTDNDGTIGSIIIAVGAAALLFLIIHLTIKWRVKFCFSCREKLRIIPLGITKQPGVGATFTYRHKCSRCKHYFVKITGAGSNELYVDVQY